MDLSEKIQQFLDDNGIYYTERANSFTLTCPNCSKEKLDIAKEEGNYICYYCADTIHGPAPEPILAELSGESIYKIKRFLRGYEYIHQLDPMSMLKDPKSNKIIKDEFSLDKEVPTYFIDIDHPKAKDGLTYLQDKRGIPDFLAMELGLLYNPLHKQVVFPVYDGNKYVGYQGRAIYGSLKYNDVEKSKYLLFENSINGDSVIVCEGPISAMKFAKTGIGFVATMGKAISEKQIDKLLSLGVSSIYLGLDRDAYKEIQSFYEKYYSKFTIYLLDVPSHRDDFGDCTFDECVEVYKKAYRLNRMSFLPDILNNG
jgi:hypothetical protein